MNSTLSFTTPQAHIGIVRLNSIVEYEEVPIGPRRTVRLVEPAHADARDGCVSTFAPMGRALMGVRVGSIVDVPLPNGNSSCVQVMAVRAGEDVAP